MHSWNAESEAASPWRMLDGLKTHVISETIGTEVFPEILGPSFLKTDFLKTCCFILFLPDCRTSERSVITKLFSHPALTGLVGCAVLFFADFGGIGCLILRN